MSIALVVTAGFGNGTLSGTVKVVVLRGYDIGVEVIVVATGRAVDITMTPDDRSIKMPPETRIVKLQADNRRITFI